MDNYTDRSATIRLQLEN